MISRWGSYHGNTLGALDLSGRPPLRRPYEPWLGRFRQVSAAYPYRADDPGAMALGDGAALAAELEHAIQAAGPGTVAAFVAEPIVGATLAAAVPPDDYWPAIAAVCRRHGVLLIADEVMTGFGRTGRWFGLDHWGVRPDLLVAAKGATTWETHIMGAQALEKYGTTLPDDTIESIKRNKVALKGPQMTPVGKGFTSVNVGLRKAARSLRERSADQNLAKCSEPLSRYRSGDRSREHRRTLFGPRAYCHSGRGREPEDRYRKSDDAHLRYSV